MRYDNFSGGSTAELTTYNQNPKTGELEETYSTDNDSWTAHWGDTESCSTDG